MHLINNFCAKKIDLIYDKKSIKLILLYFLQQGIDNCVFKVLNYISDLQMLSHRTIIKYVKFQNYAFMKIKKYFMKDKKLYLIKPHTLGA